ncbi:hypothetical protein [Saccharomonospora sp. NB11]|jgi:hypothetical protein|uniref:hypothetical protein n=1 Tax=Saccharomonospora sp. NB11 TaxID=1642298 RepID=UPI0018D1973F|nr:hypothetical protein [Saccharomonospora sp. NB11]
MTAHPSGRVKDENDNLISVLQASLEYAWQMETYIADAEREGDTELASYFRRVRENTLAVGEEGKQLLAHRLSRD